MLVAGALSILAAVQAATATPADEGGPRFQRLDSPEPPHRSIFALHQDSDGFLWIGTQDGLARYDGYEMRTYRHDPSDGQSLSNSSVRVILEDSGGQLWVGTENGLNRLDRQRLTVERVPTPGHLAGDGPWFHCAFEDRQGGLWFGTDNGLLVRDPGEDVFHSQVSEEGNAWDLRDPIVVGVQQDLEGDIWVVTTDLVEASLHRVGRQGTIEELLPLNGPGLRFYAFLIDSQGRFWIHPSAPLEFDANSGDPVSRAEQTMCIESRAAVERQEGGIWMACDDGLYSSDPETGHIKRHHVVQVSGAWLENYGRALLEDRSGALWIGTEGGLYRFDPRAKTFSHLKRNPENPNSMSGSAVSSVVEAPNGDLWVSTYGGGLNLIDRETGSARRFCVDPERSDRCTGSVIWHLHSSADGTLWIAGDELWSLDPGADSVTLRSPAGVIDGHLTYIVDDDGGVLWLGGTGGRLYRYTIITGALEVRDLDIGPVNPETDHRLDSLLLEGATLWLGLGSALIEFDTIDGSTQQTKLSTPDGTSLTSLGTWAIHRDRAGRFWLGSSVGLIRYESSDGVLHLFTTHDGLPGSAVYSILEDAHGVLWLGTNQGLSRFDPALSAGKRFRSYTTADDIGNLEFNRHAAHQCADGTMVFGGMDGLTFFHPEGIRDNTFVPPVRITEIDVGSRKGVRSLAPEGLHRLVLAPGDTTVSLRFAALSFTAPDRNRYAYRLEGFETAWVDAGTRRTTQYTNLPPGAYRFRVRGSNNDGIWNEEGAALEMVVRPTLWETWWLRPTVVVLLVGAVWTAYRYRERKKREVDKLRMRIAGDLHDDLSSDLSGIAVLADMVQQADHLGELERRDLGMISDASLRMADGLRDIVWYIDPDHDSLQATVRRMRSVSSTLLRGLSCGFSADLPERGRALPVNVRRNVFLIFKEAVHNVARHAEATGVEIEITVSGDSLRLKVADDGRGFDPTVTTDGHGLRSMNRRAEEVGGRLEIHSTPGTGSELLFAVEMAGSRDAVGPRVGTIVGGGSTRGLEG